MYSKTQNSLQSKVSVKCWSAVFFQNTENPLGRDLAASENCAPTNRDGWRVQEKKYTVALQEHTVSGKGIGKVIMENMIEISRMIKAMNIYNCTSCIEIHGHFGNTYKILKPVFTKSPGAYTCPLHMSAPSNWFSFHSFVSKIAHRWSTGPLYPRRSTAVWSLVFIWSAFRKSSKLRTQGLRLTGAPAPSCRLSFFIYFQPAFANEAFQTVRAEQSDYVILGQSIQLWK